jgi:hypothetical protein
LGAVEMRTKDGDRFGEELVTLEHARRLVDRVHYLAASWWVSYPSGTLGR